MSLFNKTGDEWSDPGMDEAPSGLPHRCPECGANCRCDGDEIGGVCEHECDAQTEAEQ